MADEQTAPEGLDIEATVADIADAILPQEEGSEAAAAPAEETEQEVAEGAPAAEEKPAAEKEPGSVDTIPAGIVDAPPDTWRKEAKEAWATIPPVVKEELRKREADIKQYYDSVRQPAEVGKTLEGIIRPYMPMFQSTGTDPWENMKAMFAIQERLMNGSPEQKLAIVQGFAQQAGVKFENGALAPAPDATAQYVKQLEQRLGQLEGGVKSVTSVVHEARIAELQQNIRKFAEDTEAHPHFHDVADGITHLITTGAANTLDQAYQMACSADPVVRQKVFDAAVAKATEARDAAEKDRTVKARAVSRTKVRSTTTRTTPQPLGDIDDTLKTTLAEIQSR